MMDRGATTLQARTARLLRWLEKQRRQHLDMVLDADDASRWCAEEADAIADHIGTIKDLWRAASPPRTEQDRTANGQNIGQSAGPGRG